MLAAGGSLGANGSEGQVRPRASRWRHLLMVPSNAQIGCQWIHGAGATTCQPVAAVRGLITPMMGATVLAAPIGASSYALEICRPR